MSTARYMFSLLPLVAFTGALILLNLWLQGFGYVSDPALAESARALLMLGAEDGEFSRLGLLQPQLTSFLLMPVHAWWPWLYPAPAYLLGALFATALLLLFYRHERSGWSRTSAFAFTLCFATNPLLLWAASSGGNAALYLLLYYLVCRTVLELQRSNGTLSYMTLGVLVAVLAVVDPRGLYLAVALMPFLPLIVHPKVLQETTAGTLLIVFAPLLLLLLAWVYLVSIYTTYPVSHLVSSVLHGMTVADHRIGDSGWLFRFGGGLLSPLAMAGLILITGFPACVWVLGRLARRNRPQLGAAVLTILLLPVVAAAVATLGQLLRHPLHLLFLELAALMAVITDREMRPRHPERLAVLLLAGNMLILPWMNWLSDPDLSGWWRGVIGQSPAAEDVRLREMARWTNRLDDLMIDDRLGYPLIAHRGTVRGLIVPSSAQFQKAITSGELAVSWVAVPNPRAQGGTRDQINFRFPRLYDYGMPGYQLAYDDGVWRIYGHEPLPVGFVPVRLRSAADTDTSRAGMGKPVLAEDKNAG